MLLLYQSIVKEKEILAFTNAYCKQYFTSPCLRKGQYRKNSNSLSLSFVTEKVHRRINDKSSYTFTLFIFYPYLLLNQIDTNVGLESLIKRTLTQDKGRGNKRYQNVAFSFLNAYVVKNICQNPIQMPIKMLIKCLCIGLTVTFFWKRVS